MEAHAGIARAVYDGSDLYEMRAHVEAGSETVGTAMGNYQATRIAIRLFMHGKEVPQTNFSVWLAHDAARTPVLVVAEMPYGNFRGNRRRCQSEVSGLSAERGSQKRASGVKTP